MKDDGFDRRAFLKGRVAGGAAAATVSLPRASRSQQQAHCPRPTQRHKVPNQLLEPAYQSASPSSRSPLREPPLASSPTRRVAVPELTEQPSFTAHQPRFQQARPRREVRAHRHRRTLTRI